jgi:hypothetical protein
MTHNNFKDVKIFGKGRQGLLDTLGKSTNFATILADNTKGFKRTFPETKDYSIPHTNSFIST